MLITVEGNIGSGKTTLLKQLQHAKFTGRDGSKPTKNTHNLKVVDLQNSEKSGRFWSNPECTSRDNESSKISLDPDTLGLEKTTEHSPECSDHIVVFENVGLWASVKTDKTNLFENYYTDKTRWSFVFQVFVLVSRLYDMTIASKKSQIVICERCHLTDLKVFTELLYSEKNLTDIEYSVYKQMHSMVQKMLDITVDYVVYIHVHPELCLERIKTRARDGEQNISLEYLQMLHDKHTDYIKEFDQEKVLVLDGSCEDYSDERQQQIMQIVNFVQK